MFISEWSQVVGTVLCALIAFLGTYAQTKGASKVGNCFLIVYAVFGFWLLEVRGVQMPGVGATWQRLFLWNAIGTFLGAGLAAIDGLMRPGEARGRTGQCCLRDYAEREPECEVDGERYANWTRGFSIMYLNDWLVQPFAPAFEKMGGFLAVETADGKAVLNISSGPQESKDWAEHARNTFEDVRSENAGEPVRTVSVHAMEVESQALCLEFDTTKDGYRARIGKFTIIHFGQEFVGYYKIRNDAGVDMDKILASWAWISQLRQPLVTNTNDAQFRFDRARDHFDAYLITYGVKLSELTVGQTNQAQSSTELKEAVIDLREALKQSEQSKELLHVAAVRSQLGLILHLQGLFDDAEREYVRSLKTLDALPVIGLPQMAKSICQTSAIARSHLALLRDRKKDYLAADKLFEEARKLAIENRDEILAYNIVGMSERCQQKRLSNG